MAGQFHSQFFADAGILATFGISNPQLKRQLQDHSKLQSVVI
jgi:hypothetical protein